MKRNMDASMTVPEPELYAGNWNHLFGPGRTETQCRIVVDVANDTLVAAQAFDGLKWFDLSSPERVDLAESLFEVNEVSKCPGAWKLSPIREFPHWASACEVPEQHQAESLPGAAAALRPFAEIGAWLFARKLPDETPVVDVKLLNGAKTVLTRGDFKAAFMASRAIEDQVEVRQVISHAANDDPMDLLGRLVKWAEHMGGWESPVWNEASAFVAAYQAKMTADSSSHTDTAALTNVRKTTIQFTVLHDDGKDLSSMPLVDIACECDDGTYVGGGLTVLSNVVLTREQLDVEAGKLGSDATFFGHDSISEPSGT